MRETLKDKKRQAILDAATDMFLQSGYRAVSMEKIAQAAPVSKATLYKYFDSKEALLAGVIRSLCDGLLATMTEPLHDAQSLEHHFSQIATSFVDLIYSQQAIAIYRLIIAESHDFPELSQLFYQSGPQTALTRFEQYCQQLIQRGLLSSSFEVKQNADMFFSLLKGEAHLQCLLGIRELPSTAEKQDIVKQAVTFYLQGIDHVFSPQ
jgi:TetR/AcrR family transcriptional repressor of mexJK operon